jgi:hypothetical protein
MLNCPACGSKELLTPAMGTPLTARFQCKKCSWVGADPKPTEIWDVHLSERCDSCETITEKIVTVDEHLLSNPHVGPGQPLICRSCGLTKVVPWSKFARKQK